MSDTLFQSLRAESDPEDTFEVKSPLREAWRRFRRNRLAFFFLWVFLAYFLLALTAQGIEALDVFMEEEHSYNLALSETPALVDQGIQIPESAVPPSTANWRVWFGTTGSGKSVLSRVFYGTKVAFAVGTFSALLSVLIGMTLGLLAGFFGSWVDEIVVYIYSTVSSIPYLLLILAIAFIIRNGDVADRYNEIEIFGKELNKFVSLGLFNIILVIGLTSWVTLCRLVRAEVKKVRELDYVQAARAMGYGNMRILFKHILPNVFHLVIINFSLTFVIAIKSEVILTFLGVGVDKEPSWGQMISDAKSELMRGVWWPLAASGGLLFVLTLSINYVGDALRDALDPKLKDQ